MSGSGEYVLIWERKDLYEKKDLNGKNGLILKRKELCGKEIVMIKERMCLMRELKWAGEKL